VEWVSSRHCSLLRAMAPLVARSLEGVAFQGFFDELAVESHQAISGVGISGHSIGC
jgi:hypothetical protein